MADNEIVRIWCNDCSCLVQDITKHECSDKDNTSYIERLITEVFIRESLWNSVLPYKLRGPANIKVLWAEVDTCLGTVPGSSQIKWKNLRDRFVKEHAFQSAYIPSGSAAIKRKSNWPLYEALRFLIPTINYRKTQSNIENTDPDTQLSQPNKSSLTSTTNITAIKEKINALQQISLLKSQSQSRQNYRPISLSPNTSDSGSSDLILTTTSLSNPNIKAESTHTSGESFCNSPIPPKKCRKKSKATENVDNRFEEMILKELQETKPKNEHLKPDKIESFAKYIEACLRTMNSDVSKLVMKKITVLLFEED